jgi:pimeloyl-ACP methyl ester carboxylesterase
VHGAGSGPWIFDGWAPRFPGTRVEAVDLHGRRSIAYASMADYSRTVERAAAALPRPLVVAAWSMGGLVAMQAAQAVVPELLVLIEPSPPGELQGFRPDLALGYGTFDPEQVYGRFPEGVRSRPESTFARVERKRGISVPSLPCPTLVVYGEAFPDDRGRLLARRYSADELHLPGKTHWGLVLDADAVQAVAGRIASALRR